MQACTVINILKYVQCVIFALSVKQLNVTLVKKKCFLDSSWAILPAYTHLSHGGSNAGPCPCRTVLVAFMGVCAVVSYVSV